jgi:ABC-2 type transport system ATP-binding protein
MNPILSWRETMVSSKRTQIVSTVSSEIVPIEIEGLYKHYGKTQAVQGISLKIKHGQLFGLIGPDGSGKTTIFHILGGVMEASAGNVRIWDDRSNDAVGEFIQG